MKNRIISLFVAFAVIFGFIYASASGTEMVDSLIRKGDVNLDGYINALDAREALLLSAEMKKTSLPQVIWAADVDLDSMVSAMDARLILRVSAELATIPDIYYGQRISKIIIQVLESPQTPPVTNPENPTTGKGGVTSAPATQHLEFPLPAVPQFEKKSGTFAFITYGYGHGVGMSQTGALYLAKNWNYSYTWILGYYYRGLSLVINNPPATATMPNGQSVSMEEILGRVTQQEIGSDPLAFEALKAQVVVAYTNIVAANYKVKNLAYTSSYDKVDQSVKNAVREVWGQYLLYNGEPATAVFGSTSAGITSNPSEVWGGSNYPYLAPVNSYFDRLSGEYLSVKIFTADEIREIIEKFNEKIRTGRTSVLKNEIKLSDNPADWFEILAHDGAVNNNIGYITSMRIGDQIIPQRAGQILREHIFEYKIKSHCAVIEYYK